MSNWRSILIPHDASIREAIQVIDQGSLQVALVVDHEQRLQGVVTDGDVRRGLLRGTTLDASVKQIMNPSPVTATRAEAPEAVIALMRIKQLRHIPVVDDGGRVRGIHVRDHVISPERRDNLVVLMAGGLGTRLSPLTNDCPKPLLNVGGKPILETIVESFSDHGFYRFLIAVNYKADMIESHFGNGEKWGVEIDYLREREKRGTAGALSLIPERPEVPLLVMNGDVLTKVNFSHLLDFHHQHKAMATTCVRDYHLQVPYGVIQQQDGRLIAIDEKPVARMLVNAGIYVLDPSALDYLPAEQLFDMPDLLNRCLQADATIATFPIREYWMDIGKMDDFIRANHDFSEIFA